MRSTLFCRTRVQEQFASNPTLRKNHTFTLQKQLRCLAGVVLLCLSPILLMADEVVLVKDINSIGGAGSAPAVLTDFNGTLFYVADDGASGRELWRHNPATGATTRVTDINPGSGNAFFGLDDPKLTEVNGRLYVGALDGTEIQPAIDFGQFRIIQPNPA